MAEIKYHLMEHHDKHHAAHKEGEHAARKLRSKSLFLFSLIVLVALAAGLLAGYLLSGASGNSSAAAITQAQASAKALDYINSAVQGQAAVKLVSINESNGLYNLQIDVGGQLYNSFMTKDGKLLFPSGINLDAQIPAANSGNSAGANNAASIPKSDKPSVELFVMSFCPYGVQAEDLMKPVADLLGKKADIKVRFITKSGDNINSIQSLHGAVEAKEDLRQICIIKNYPDKYWSYLATFNKNCYPLYRNETALDSCWKNSAAAQGIDSAKIESCVNSDGLALIKSDEQAANSYGVSGSPTLIINGNQYNGARSSEGYKNAICSAFNNPPAECSQNVGTASQANNAPAGGCG